MIKCLSHNQLKMIPKNVKNHSNCASGIRSPIYKFKGQSLMSIYLFTLNSFNHGLLDYNNKKSIVLINIHITGFIWALTIIFVNFVILE